MPNRGVEHHAAYRESALRKLVARAKAGSPWHRERLAHVGAQGIRECDLPRIPTMTKADLMANFDAIATP